MYGDTVLFVMYLILPVSPGGIIICNWRMTKPFQGGHIVDLRSQNWKCWNVELNLGLSDPRIQPFPTQLLWESSQTAITEVMGTQENVPFGYTGRLGIQEEWGDGKVVSDARTEFPASILVLLPSFIHPAARPVILKCRSGCQPSAQNHPPCQSKYNPNYCCSQGQPWLCHRLPL